MEMIKKLKKRMKKKTKYNIDFISKQINKNNEKHIHFITKQIKKKKKRKTQKYY